MIMTQIEVNNFVDNDHFDLFPKLNSDQEASFLTHGALSILISLLIVISILKNLRVP